MVLKFLYFTKKASKPKWMQHSKATFCLSLISTLWVTTKTHPYFGIHWIQRTYRINVLIFLVGRTSILLFSLVWIVSYHAIDRERDRKRRLCCSWNNVGSSFVTFQTEKFLSTTKHLSTTLPLPLPLFGIDVVVFHYLVFFFFIYLHRILARLFSHHWILIEKFRFSFAHSVQK